jgi:hypothetical protein
MQWLQVLYTRNLNADVTHFDRFSVHCMHVMGKSYLVTCCISINVERTLLWCDVTNVGYTKRCWMRVTLLHKVPVYRSWTRMLPSFSVRKIYALWVTTFIWNPCYVGPCHQGMARLRVAAEGVGLKMLRVLRIYWISCRIQPIRGDPPYWRLDMGLMTPHRKQKKSACRVKSCALLWKRQWICGFYKWQRISWLVELASQEWLYSMELIHWLLIWNFFRHKDCIVKYKGK